MENARDKAKNEHSTHVKGDSGQKKEKHFFAEIAGLFGSQAVFKILRLEYTCCVENTPIVHVLLIIFSYYISEFAHVLANSISISNKPLLTSQ